MDKLDHVLGVGWADDTPVEFARVGLVPKGMEVYSEDLENSKFEPDVTPEYIEILPVIEPDWSIMSRNKQDTREFTSTSALYPVFAFSIEELSTIKFEEIPSKDD